MQKLMLHMSPRGLCVVCLISLIGTGSGDGYQNEDGSGMDDSNSDSGTRTDTQTDEVQLGTLKQAATTSIVRHPGCTQLTGHCTACLAGGCVFVPNNKAPNSGQCTQHCPVATGAQCYMSQSRRSDEGWQVQKRDLQDIRDYELATLGCPDQAYASSAQNNKLLVSTIRSMRTGSSQLHVDGRPLLSVTSHDHTIGVYGIWIIAGCMAFGTAVLSVVHGFKCRKPKIDVISQDKLAYDELLYAQEADPFITKIDDQGIRRAHVLDLSQPPHPRSSLAADNVEESCIPPILRGEFTVIGAGFSPRKLTPSSRCSSMDNIEL